MLNEVFEDAYKNSFLNGLDEFKENCKAFTGDNFLELNEAEKLDYLHRLDKEAYGVEKADLEPFFSRFKELVVKIYFSTEEGVKQNLNYAPLPGPYKGDVELATGAKIMIGN